MPFGATGVTTSVVESTDPLTLLAKIEASFAAQLLLEPVSQLVEIVLAGGGAGGVLQATIYYSTTEDGVFPPLADQFVAIFFAPDRKTMADKLSHFYTHTPIDRTTFVEKVTMGDGIVWVDLVVFTVDVGARSLMRRSETASTASDNVNGLERPGSVIPSPAIELRARASQVAASFRALWRAKKGD